MKVIENEVSNDEDLPTIRISTQDLVGVISSTANSEETVELTVGETFDKSYALFDSIEDIRRHSSSISVPFTLKIGEVTLRVRTNHISLKYSDSSEPTATALKNRLLEYQPWYRFCFTNWFPALLTSLFVLAWAIGFPETNIAIAFLGIFSIATALMFLTSKLDKTHVWTAERKGFIRRNFDKLVLLLVGAVIAVGVSAIWEGVSINISSEIEAGTE